MILNKDSRISEYFKNINELEIIDNSNDLKRLSKEFYNYSPVFK